MSGPPEANHIPRAAITIAPELQARDTLSQDTIAEYAESYSRGEVLPPLVVFWDGQRRWLADGFHRYAAMVRLGWDTVAVDQRPGTKLEAMFHAAGANATHGLRRTPEDTRRAIALAFAAFAEQGVNPSNVLVAKAVGASESTVRKYRPNLATNEVEAPRVGRDNRVRPMPVSPPEPAPAPEPEPAPQATEQRNPQSFVDGMAALAMQQELGRIALAIAKTQAGLSELIQAEGELAIRASFADTETAQAWESLATDVQTLLYRLERLGVTPDTRKAAQYAQAY